MELKKSLREHKPGHLCLVIEDLITSGISILETISPLEKEGLKVQQVAVFLDREQGGCQYLESKGYILQSVLTMAHLLDILERRKKVDQEKLISVKNFLKIHQAASI